MNSIALSDSQRIEQQSFMSRVYAWMSAGLIVSAAVSVFVAFNPHVAKVIIDNRWVFYGILILQLAAVFTFVGILNKISSFQAGLLFLLYSLLTGMTLSVIFFVYTISSIVSIFFITATTFAFMSVYGYVTKRDLTGIGNILIMGLFCLILASVVNLFIRNNTADLVLSWIGVVIFVGLTAYDTQKIKNLNVLGNAGTDDDKKEAIDGALTLYLDFVNLFLELLRIFGKKR